MFNQVIQSILTQICYFEDHSPTKSHYFHLLGNLNNLFFISYFYVENAMYSNIGNFVPLFADSLRYFFTAQLIYLITSFNVIILGMVIYLIIANLAIPINLMEVVNKLETKTKILIFFSNICYLVYSLFMQPLLCIFLHSYQKETKSILTYNNILAIVLVHILSLIHFIFNQHSLLICSRRINIIQSSFLHFLVYLMQSSQPYIFIFVQTINSLQLQSTLELMQTIFYFIMIFVQKLYSNIDYSKKLIYINSVFFTFSIMNLIQIQNILMIVIFPLISKLLLYIYESELLRIRLTEPQQLSYESLNLLLYVEFVDDYCSLEKKIMISSVMYSKHRKQCKNQICTCHKLIQQHNTDTLCFISNQIQKQLQQNIIATIRKKRCWFNDFIYLCHYISAQQISGSQQDIYQKIEDMKYFEKLSQIHKVQWIAFTFNIKQQLYVRFTSNISNETGEQIDLSMKITAFSKSETVNQFIKTELIKHIKMKLQFYKQLKVKNTHIIDLIHKTLRELIEEQVRLEQLYHKFPSHRNQSVLMFYYSEIVNDWHKAYYLSSISSNTNQAFDIEYISNQMSYLIFSYENKLLKMYRFSEKAPQVFGYLPDEFCTLDPNVLIPNSIREIHDQKIEGFLDEGRGAFFRAKGINISDHKSGYVQSIHFFYDICFDNDQYFRFINFVAQSEWSQGILIIDDQMRIQGISKTLFQMMNYSKKFIDSFDVKSALHDVSSVLFFPLWENNVIDKKIIMYFPNKHTLRKMVHSNQHQKIQLCEKRNNLIKYEIQGDIVNRINYYVLKVEKLTEYEPEIVTSHQIVINLNESMINIEDDVVIPYESSCIIERHIERPNRTVMSYQFEQQDLISKIPSKKNEFTIKMLGDVLGVEQMDNPQYSKPNTGNNLRKSNLFAKFQIYMQMQNKKIQGKWIMPLILIIDTSQLIVIMSIFIAYFMSNVIVNDQLTYYDSVRINHYLLEPLHKSIMIQLTIQNFYKQESNQDYDSLFQTQLNFSNISYYELYDELKFNYQHYRQNYMLLKIIDKVPISVQLQVVHQYPLKLQQYNITLIESLNMYLDYFYKTHQNTELGTISFNPEFSFRIANYLTFIKIFENLCLQIYDEALYEQKQKSFTQLVQIYPAIIVPLLLMILSAYYAKKYYRSIQKLIGLIKIIDLDQLENDKNRLIFLAENLNSSSDLLHSYKFNLEAKERFLEQQLKFQIEKTKLKFPVIQMKRSFIYIPIISILLVNIVLTLTLNQISQVYLNKFETTMKLFKSLQDIGILIPASFSQVQLLHNWDQYGYLNDNDRIQYLQQIEQVIKKISSFNDIDMNQEFQFSDYFLVYYKNLLSSSLCSYLIEQTDEYLFCLQSENAILDRGLLVVLNNYQNQIFLQYQTDFADEIEKPFEEMNVAYICSNIISMMCELMMRDIGTKSETLQSNIMIITIISLLLILFIVLIVNTIYYTYITKTLTTYKQLFYIFPQETLFSNEVFETELRRIAKSESFI